MSSYHQPLRRAFLAIVAGFTLLVFYVGMFTPAGIGDFLPFETTPLNARFIGALYGAATVALLVALVDGSRAAVDDLLIMILVWTGGLLWITFLYRDTLLLSRREGIVWLAAYIAFPFGAALLRLLGPRTANLDAPAAVAALPHSLRRTVAAQGLVCLVLGLALYLLPALMSLWWPWRLPQLIAQVYAWPFLALGVGGLLASRRSAWAEVRHHVALLLTTVILLLLVAALHAGRFDPAHPATWLWYAGLPLFGLLLAWLALRARRTTAHVVEPTRG